MKNVVQTGTEREKNKKYIKILHRLAPMESWLAESNSRQCAEMQLNYPAILHVLPKPHWKTWVLAAEATAASLSPVPGRRSWRRHMSSRDREERQDWSPEKPRSGQLAKKKTSFRVSRASQLVNTEGAVRTRGTRMETLLGRLGWSLVPNPVNGLKGEPRPF